MKTIYDNIDTIDRADDRFILEQDEDGLLYETSNAVTRALVCSGMFYDAPSIESLREQFPDDIAERYLEAAKDLDK